MARRVIAVPVIHTAADLGSLVEAVRTRYQRELGAAAWENRQRAVAGLWDAITQRIAALHLDYSVVRIYQDGLPVCAHELDIVRELARAGSRNHQLILELLDQGAVLVGTEDPQLLLREYQMQRRQLLPAESATRGPVGGAAEAAEVLALRDRWIAQRIAETLLDGQTGLLFLGAAHRLDALGALGIRIETL
jgi:hypothetical protein